MSRDVIIPPFPICMFFSYSIPHLPKSRPVTLDADIKQLGNYVFGMWYVICQRPYYAWQMLWKQDQHIFHTFSPSSSSCSSCHDSSFSFSFSLHLLLISHRSQLYALLSGGVANCDLYFHKLSVYACVCINGCFPLLYARTCGLVNNIFQYNVNPHSLETTKYKPLKTCLDGNGGKIERYCRQSQEEGVT